MMLSLRSTGQIYQAKTRRSYSFNLELEVLDGGLVKRLADRSRVIVAFFYGRAGISCSHI